ncbi:MAG: diaminopimelate epimerase [Henriciella sp.]
MKLWKMNGAGNAFAVFDARKQAFAPTTAQIQEIAKTMKADQIMSIENDARADAFLRIWNADGGEVKACGNGTRAVAHLLLEELNRNEVRIQTEADLLKGSRVEGGLVSVDMGSPLMSWEDIPLAEKMDVRGIDVKIGPIDDPYLARPAVVSMGNPHAVFFVEDVDAYDLAAIGPLVEGHPIFPERANMSLAQILSPTKIRLRVWERGTGITKACGTAACATLVCAVRANKAQRKATISVDGGELIVEWRETDDHVYLTGPVELEFETELTV